MGGEVQLLALGAFLTQATIFRKQMKTFALKYIAVALVLSFYDLSVPPLINGQSFVYLSNTDQPVTQSSLTGSFDIGFTTGTNPSGYLLNSLTLLFADNNTPVLSSASLDDYSTITSFGNSVEVGSSGYYTFTPESPLALAANKPYALLIVPNDALVEFNVSHTTSAAFTSIDNWNIPGLGGSIEPLFAIAATPIEPTPEPAETALICASFLACALFRFKTINFFEQRANMNVVEGQQYNSLPEPRLMGAVRTHFRVRSATARHARLTDWAGRFGF